MIIESVVEHMKQTKKTYDSYDYDVEKSIYNSTMIYDVEKVIYDI